MNDEQQGRLNKVLKTVGYIISSAVVWFYTTRGLASLLASGGLEEGKEVELFVVVAISWPIIGIFLSVACYSLYGWIRTGKKGDLFEALFGGEKK